MLATDYTDDVRIGSALSLFAVIGFARTLLTQRRKAVPRFKGVLCVFAPLRLCVSHFLA